MALLAKSAIREALALGDLKILDTTGTVPESWLMTPRFVMPTNPTTLGDLVQESQCVGFQFVHGDPEALQPCSVDLHLADEFLIPKPNLHYERGDAFDTARKVQYTEVKAPSITIPGNGFMLARTQEMIQLSDRLVGWVDGRSSFGRFGLFVQNAGLVDSGFAGTITLEIYNALPHPVILYAGTKCCQLEIEYVYGDTEGGYKGVYQGQIHPKGSELHRHVPKG